MNKALRSTVATYLSVRVLGSVVVLMSVIGLGVNAGTVCYAQIQPFTQSPWQNLRGGVKSPQIESVKGFGYGFFVRGGTNLIKGAWGGAKEMFYTFADAGGMLAETTARACGRNFRYECSGGAGQFLEDGGSCADYYGDLVPNVATFGVYGQGKALALHCQGELSADEAGQAIGGGAVLQLLGSRIIPKNTGSASVWRVPLRSVPEQASVNVGALMSRLTGRWLPDVLGYGELRGEGAFCKVVTRGKYVAKQVHPGRVRPAIEDGASCRYIPRGYEAELVAAIRFLRDYSPVLRRIIPPTRLGPHNIIVQKFQKGVSSAYVRRFLDESAQLRAKTSCSEFHGALVEGLKAYQDAGGSQSLRVDTNWLNYLFSSNSGRLKGNFDPLAYKTYSIDPVETWRAPLLLPDSYSADSR